MTPAQDPPPKLSLIITGCAVALFALVFVFSAFTTRPPEPASASAAPSRPVVAKPLSIEERVRTVAKAAMNDAAWDGLNYEGIQTGVDEDDNGRDTGQVNIFVHYHLASMPSGDSRESKFSAALYQKLFALDPSIGFVVIAFDGPIKDQYGHTNEREYINYDITRYTFSKIDWNGFEPEGLCALLRSEGGDNSCGLWPGIVSLGDDSG